MGGGLKGVCNRHIFILLNFAMWGLIYIHTVKFVMDILRPTIDGGGIKLRVFYFDFTCPLLY
nr:MAG TPA: hypothetical protein [Bacteriophage sp.]